MSHITTTIGRIVVTRTSSAMSVDDLRQILVDYRTSHSMSRQKISRIIVLESGALPPEGDAKEFMAKHTAELNSISASVHYVITETSPFRAARLRMFAVGVMSMKGIDTYIHETLSDALERAGMSASEAARTANSVAP